MEIQGKYVASDTRQVTNGASYAIANGFREGKRSVVAERRGSRCVVHRRADCWRQKNGDSTNEESRLFPHTYFLYINELTTYLLAFFSWMKRIARESSVVPRAQGRQAVRGVVRHTPLTHTHTHTYIHTHTETRVYTHTSIHKSAHIRISHTRYTIRRTHAHVRRSDKLVYIYVYIRDMCFVKKKEGEKKNCARTHGFEDVRFDDQIRSKNVTK